MTSNCLSEERGRGKKERRFAGLAFGQKGHSDELVRIEGKRRKTVFFSRGEFLKRQEGELS